QLQFIPINLRFFFNDPSGAFKYDLFALLNYDKQLTDGLFLNTSVRGTWSENVSDVTQPSNSELPHVRSDIAEYMRDRGVISLNRLLLNKYYQIASEWYGRGSLGYYEQMYGGAGGQVLYMPVNRDWAVDLSVDALQQRSPQSAFGFRDYSVVTAIGAFHYRFPSVGVTTTVRAGRFLAKDEGARFEIKRRFRSGVEAGAWYTITNANDTQPPGSPDDPYRDKGLFISIPLSSMLTRDTQQRSTIAIVDFTRDVGQMVESPGDLYRQMEERLLFDRSDYGPFADFAK
ncbi:MAG: YjbH domain-containing protein, partial [Pseudomonadota bacterium]